ncbi:2Fe-2S iron-sulfur cluster binding domain-containing protein, partial [Paenibacillus sp. IB182496]
MSEASEWELSPMGYRLRCTVNGRPVELDTAPTRRMLDVLRDELGLTGTKLSCGIGRCGACMVLVDGRPVNACLAMAYQCADRGVTTIEGVAGAGAQLHPLQQAFLEEGGYQCGYCTPGMIVAAAALLAEYPQPTEAQLVEALSGNLCRCTGYGGIRRAIRAAASGESQGAGAVRAGVDGAATDADGGAGAAVDDEAASGRAAPPSGETPREYASRCGRRTWRRAPWPRKTSCVRASRRPAAGRARSASLSLRALNEAREPPAFAALLGGLFEHSPWVAEQAWARRPFATAAALRAAFADAVRSAPLQRQLALLRAHPELGAR